MSSFDEREEAFEKRFAADEAQNFKALARRNRALGMWAAGLAGKSPTEAETYAKTLVAAQVEHTDDGALFEALRTELSAAGVEMSDHRIRRKMEETLAQARKDVAAGQ